MKEHITPTEYRELAERLGICWHEKVISKFGYHECSCGTICDRGIDLINHINKHNSDFRDPIVVLREMRKREDYDKFVENIGGSVEWERHERIFNHSIPDKYILDDTGLLAKELLEWLRKENYERR